MAERQLVQMDSGFPIPCMQLLRLISQKTKQS